MSTPVTSAPDRAAGREVPRTAGDVQDPGTVRQPEPLERAIQAAAGAGAGLALDERLGEEFGRGHPLPRPPRAARRDDEDEFVALDPAEHVVGVRHRDADCHQRVP